MKNKIQIIGIILFILLLTFTGCKKDRFLKDVEGTHHVTYVMGTASYNCDMIVTYQESDDLFIITLTSGEDFIGQDVVLKGIRNEDIIEIQFEEDGYQGNCNVYSGTLQLVSKKIELEFEACGLHFSAYEN